MDAPLPPAWHAPPAIVRPAPATGFLPPPRPGLPDARYRAVIDEVRKGLSAGLPARRGYRVAVLDVTAPDFDAEVRRIDPALRTHSGELRQLGAGMGAYSVAYPVKGGIACLAAGPPPGTSVDGILAGVAGVPVARNGLDDEAFARIALWHESAHCVLGRSEAEADAFAFLAVLRDGTVPAGALATWAAWREVAEMTNPDAGDDHVGAAALWSILARAGVLAGDPAFKAMGVEGLAALARAFVARDGIDGPARAHLVRVRRAVAAGAVLVASAYPERGPPSLASLDGWLEGAGASPDFARLRDLRRALSAGSGPMAPARPDAQGFEAFLSAKAAGGDAVSGAMLEAVRAGDAVPVPVGDSYGARMALRIPYRIVPGTLEARLSTLAADAAPSLATVNAGRSEASAAALPDPR